MECVGGRLEGAEISVAGEEASSCAPHADAGMCGQLAACHCIHSHPEHNPSLTSLPSACPLSCYARLRAPAPCTYSNSTFAPYLRQLHLRLLQLREEVRDVTRAGLRDRRVEQAGRGRAGEMPAHRKLGRGESACMSPKMRRGV